MKFKVGDKVRVREKKDLRQVTRTMDKRRERYAGEVLTIAEILGENYITEETEVWWKGEMLEPIADPLVTKIEERNNKPQKPEEPWLEEYFEVLEEEAAIRPTHYQNTSGNGKDLFDEWYERYYHSNKRFTGREVFIEIMKSVAERYIRRYPNKNDEDILKGIETLTRLKQMEELEEEDAKN